jgi:vitamin B12 transporter
MSIRAEGTIMPFLLLAAAAVFPVAEFEASERFSDPILVSARAPLKASEIGSSVTVLTAADLARLQAPLLADILRLQPGVTLSANGGAGGFTAVRLRGAEGEQTTLVIDGVKVADPAAPGGGTDFTTLSTAHVARVEILRGPQSLAWGSQAIGGVIAIETDWPEDALVASGRAEGGSRNAVLVRGDVAGRLGPVRLAAGGNWQKTDGISAASEARGATERDGFETVGGQLRAEIPLGAGFLVDLRGRFQDSEFGQDGFPPPNFALADTPDRGRMRELGGAAGLVYSDPRLTARAGWQLSDTRRRTWLPGEVPETNFRSEGRIERLDLRLDLKLAPWLTFAGGVERELSRLAIAYPSSFDPDPVPFRARATLTGGFVQALLSPAPGLDLNAGVRQDDHDRFGGATTLAANASWRPGEGPLRLKASYGEGFKAPSLFQLYSDFGNARLSPERAAGVDAGAELRLLDGNLRASATWFSRTTRDQIDFVSCFGVADPICTDRPFGTYDNVARTRARGVELALGADPVAGLLVDVQLSTVDARNRTAGSANEGNRLARRPEYSMALVADYAAPAGWRLGATLSHVSASFDNAANTRRNAGYVLADVRAGFALTEAVELYGRVTNLFDETYETASFYGQPGRQAFVGVRARY